MNSTELLRYIAKNRQFTNFVYFADEQDLHGIIAELAAIDPNGPKFSVHVELTDVNTLLIY